MGFDQTITEMVAKRGGTRVVPPVPAGRATHLPVDDDVEQGEDSEGGIPLALFIEYRDTRGRSSHRRIACKRYEPANRTLLAFCFERRSMRRFRVDRILVCACPTTGEVFDLEIVVAGLLKGGLPVRDDRLARVLTVLVFLMRCDREAHPLERAEIEDAVSTFALRFDGDDDLVEEGLSLAMRIAPDIKDFGASLRWIAASPDRIALARLLVQFVERVVVADGVIASEEAYFAGILRDVLREMIGGGGA